MRNLELRDILVFVIAKIGIVPLFFVITATGRDRGLPFAFDWPDRWASKARFGIAGLRKDSW
jgi:hypothetical protein